MFSRDFDCVSVGRYNFCVHFEQKVRDRADWASVLHVGIKQESVASSSLLVAVKKSLRMERV
jgi:hypothetical protein